MRIKQSDIVSKKTVGVIDATLVHCGIVLPPPKSKSITNK